jgi:hypothetical protein
VGVIAGAPNVVRGGSHPGNVAAADMIRAGAVDVLASDYVPPPWWRPPRPRPPCRYWRSRSPPGPPGCARRAHPAGQPLRRPHAGRRDRPDRAHHRRHHRARLCRSRRPRPRRPRPQVGRSPPEPRLRLRPEARRRAHHAP